MATTNKKKRSALDDVNAGIVFPSILSKDMTDRIKAAQNDDIAPVRTVRKETTSFYDDWAPIRTVGTLSKDDKKERKWFNQGLFEDGWQAGDIAKTILGTATDLDQNVKAGVLGIGEKVVDAAATGIGALGGALGNDKFKAKTKDFIAKDLYDEHKLASNLMIASNPFASISKILGLNADDVSVLGEKSDDLAYSGGQLLGTVALQGVGVPWFVTTGATSFGSEVEAAFQEGANYKEAALRGGISAGADILTEKLTGGIKFGGKALDDALLRPLTQKISNKVARNLVNVGLDATGEGFEEIMASVANNLGEKLYNEDAKIKDLLLSEQAMDEYIESFIGGFVLGGGAGGSNAVQSIKTGRDYKTGLTDNEQKVVDAEVQKRIAEQETDGKKLSMKERTAIEEEVRSELEKGGISIDSIESALGGDTYNSYKALSDEMDEYTSLNKMKAMEMTGEQSDRLAELKEKNKQASYESEKARLKEQLSQEVDSATQSDRFLRESYNEKSRRGQAFEADLTKYKSKEQQAIIQKAIDSKILNNTRRTHEFVDMISKISADKGVSFYFTNNKKLKESGFAVDGATVNGYVQGNNISLNIQSAKSLNKVVGHEITHVLEGTELYAELQNVVKEYATTKGEYATRLEALQELYKDVKDANIENELTADLIGDYLFTDEKFINNLSTKNPNIFKKIYEEIKYLVKVATAGSKEAKELEKVKRIFEKAYKTQESGRSIRDVKFNFGVTQEIINKYVDAAYEKENTEDYKKYSEVSERLMNDVSDEIDLTGYNHALRDNDIRHIRNSHGENTNEKYPVTKEDIKNIPWIVENYDKVYVVQRDSKRKGLIYVKASTDGLVYYLEQITSKYGGEPLLINKQMIKTGMEDIPNLFGLRDAITKKQSEVEFLNDLKKVPQVYVQDVYQHHSINNVAQNGKNASEKTDFSLSSMSNTFFGDPDMSASEFAKVDYRETQGYKDYVEQCVNNYRQTRKNFVREDAEQEIKDAIDGIVQVAIAAKKAGYDIYDDNTKRSKKDSKNRLLFSSLEPNSDYFTSNDISTICDKRQNFAEIYDDIVRTEEAKGIPADKRFFNNVDNYFYLHKIMAEKGLTQPCRQCYVESMRKNLAPMASAFLRLVNETDANNTKNDQLYNQKGKDKGKLKTNNAKLRERVLEILGEYDMTAADLSVETLTTEDGLAQLKIQAPMLYEAFNSFYGQSKPKMPKSATPFRFGELTALLTDEKGKIKQSLVDKINATGGFRLQSYSDFQIQNFTDVLQVIFEAGTLGLNGHAYTKVPAFLDATEGTNLKRNISIFMYKDGNEWKIDRNDSFPYTLEEIYDIVDSDKDGNTGIIAVSQNDEMSAWIMANDRVGYGIPFHKSGVKMGIVRDTNVTTEDGRTVKGYKGIKDHTRQQTEVWKKNQVDEEGKVVAKANTKVSKGINIYEFWDFDNKKGLSKNELIKKNLKAYINACEKAGYLPKFRDYVMNNDKMLNDVLRYSKELGMVSQEATIDDISFTYKGYRIPYGYYKFLGDFGMFTPDGFASPHEVLSLKNYDFKKAKDFFKDAESLRRNEILQQFSNGQERENYRKSNLTAEQLAEIVKKKRGEVADNVITRHSLSEEGEQDIAPIGNYNVYGKDIALEAPIRSDIPAQQNEDIAPVRQDIEPAKEAPVDDDIAPVKAPKTDEEIAKVLEIEPKTTSQRNRRKAAIYGALLLDKGLPFENLSIKTKNRELIGKWNYTLYSEARAQRFIGNGTDGVKSLNAIREEVGNAGHTADFYDYMYHKHNVDRMSLADRYDKVENKPVFGESITSDISQRIVEQYENEHPEFMDYANDVYAYNRALRQMLVDDGVISQETADLWEEMYPHYIPTRRVGEAGLNINVPLDSRRTGINAPVKRATGGNTDILPLFDTMAMRTLQTFKATAKNSFGVELKNTLGTVLDSKSASVDEVIENLELQDELLQKGKNGHLPTFTVFENGERITFEITENMYDALKPTSEALSKTSKIASTFSNVRRGLLTEFNPTFLLTNGIKDIQDVLINSQHPARTYRRIPEAYAQIAKKGYWYNEYMNNGGEQNSYFNNETNTFDTKNKGLKKLLDAPPFSTISKLNNFIETAPRLAEYIASREAGRSIEVSMLDSARVTTNFRAGGDLTKFLNRNGATFLNASVQGAMQQVRNVREAQMNGFKGWAMLATKFAIAGVPAMILNSLIWDDDEEYEELSDYVKQNYHILWKTEDGQFIRIPKGRAVAVIEDAMEQVVNLSKGNDEADLKSFLELVITNLAPNNPLENNILAPIIQVKNNETWYGEDMVPTRLQDLPAAEQYDESTDMLSRKIGEKLNVSPVKVNYLLDQYSGGLGDMVLPMMTPQAENKTDSKIGTLMAPLRNKFVTDGVINNQNVADFYDMSEELTTNAKMSTATDKDILMNKYMNSVSGQMSELYKRKREIQNSDMKNSTKYDMVRQVQEQIVELSKEGLNNYSKVNINGNYATVGGLQYKKNDSGEWQKLTDEQIEKQEEMTRLLNISPSEFWSADEESMEAYNWAYQNPEKHTFSKSITDDVVQYRAYASDLYNIKADKDSYGKSISGTRKKKVASYINDLDIPIEAKYILFKSEYPSDDSHNMDIINYLNDRDDISAEEMRTILLELDFKVDEEGYITW